MKQKEVLYKDKKWLLKQLWKKRSQKEIAKICNVHIGTIETYVNKYKLQGIKKIQYELPFKVSDPYFAYLVGLFLTDGYYNPKTLILEIQLQVSDRYILQLLQSKFGGQLKYYGNNARLYFSRNKSANFTHITGIQPGAKTFTAKVPKVFPKLLHKYIIRGIIDGDGTIRRNGVIRIYSESLPLLKFVEEYCLRNNLTFSYQENSKVFSFGVQLKAGVMIYNNFVDLALPRKRAKIKKIVDDIVRTYDMINHKKWCN